MLDGRGFARFLQLGVSATALLAFKHQQLAVRSGHPSRFDTSQNIFTQRRSWIDRYSQFFNRIGHSEATEATQKKTKPSNARRILLFRRSLVLDGNSVEWQKSCPFSAAIRGMGALRLE